MPVTPADLLLGAAGGAVGVALGPAAPRGRTRRDGEAPTPVAAPAPTDATHALLQAVFEGTPDPVYLKDRQGRYLLCNSAAPRAIGRPARDILARTDAELLARDEARAVRAADARVLGGEGPLTVEEVVGVGDARRTYQSSKGAFAGPDGLAAGVFGLSRDVTARREAEAAVAEARVRAEAASRAKSDFLARMSHELRTPLNAILGYVDLLAMGLAGPTSDAQREYLGRVEGSGRHLLTLIDDVLDVARIEAGELAVERRPASVADVVEGALALVQPQAEAKGVTAAWARGAEDPALRYVGDPDRVRQVLLNLLGNAIKFTPPGGRVTVRAASDADADGAPRVALAVADTGIGIAADQQARIFEPFVQVDGGLNRRSGGTGLGLAISRQLVHLMGGELSLASAPGMGATFTLRLPASTPGWEARVRLGERLVARMPDVLAAYVDALRRDPALPAAAEAARPTLEGHAGTLLAALAHDFAVRDDDAAGRGAAGRGAAERGALIADGGAFKALLAARHGGQRGRLGWGERELARDFAHLGDAIARVLGGGTRGAEAEALDDQLALLRAFLAEAEALAADGLRRGVHTGTHPVPAP
ncbi:PAS domain-containing sensor histidine kinase [Roseisolibacter sp. H3M3-2]|uniref:PAS domain-containing sensor histidine kinase n=1 Tax=Roseisolibacter sp. H3M3-2 TaxID=3031323 RepID=UPI0023D9BB48|nr:PAS domain-containing sensor histidine kinase [Roseisolibacter sp. H3M3-2]MDF1504372.1 ATP-binding protein [Roseisolibacter sp. H3M3-2]